MPLTVPPPAQRNFIDRLRRWPHVLAKLGPECNRLLAHLGEKPLSRSQIKALHLHERLGILIFPHALVTLISHGVDPRYQITPKGRDYLALLRHHGFLPAENTRID